MYVRTQIKVLVNQYFYCNYWKCDTKKSEHNKYPNYILSVLRIVPIMILLISQ